MRLAVKPTRVARRATLGSGHIPGVWVLAHVHDGGDHGLLAPCPNVVEQNQPPAKLRCGYRAMIFPKLTYDSLISIEKLGAHFLFQ